MPSILFVCTANICRSPMVAALFQQRLSAARPAGPWHVASAGTWAREGQPAARHVQLAMRERGIDLRGHRSRCVSSPLLAEFDLILTVARHHQEALRIEFPQLAARTQLLSEMSGQRYDLPDPIRGDVDDVRELILAIETILDQGFERILSEVEGTRQEAIGTASGVRREASGPRCG